MRASIKAVYLSRYIAIKIMSPSLSHLIIKFADFSVVL
jgi:hypothetical protein